MIMYKLITNKLSGETKTVLRITDNAYIPFDPANTDYQAFKKAVNEGAELQDADGNLMSPEQAKAYVATLP